MATDGDRRAAGNRAGPATPAAAPPPEVTVSTLVCSACGAAADPASPYPFRCARAVPGDDVDHVLQRRLDLAHPPVPEAGEPHPFVHWGARLHAWHAARAGGMPAARWRALVLDLDTRIRAVDGRGFTVTPFGRADALSAELGFSPAGGVWVKDETNNVAGSHKARHLMGIALWLAVMEELGRTSPAHRPPLAIASCGNAALAAAVLAKAMEWPLRVFVPPDAARDVLERLGALGAEIVACPRAPGETGDPCVHAFRRAVAAGSIPFTCQGTENGLAIEGGETLAYEILESAAAAGLTFGHWFVQVGGGALASACVQGLRFTHATGALAQLPRLHAVQTRGCAPLVRAFDRVCARLRDGVARDAVLHECAVHRSHFMWAWEQEPRGLAGGILDDETYDWRAIVTGMLESGGAPVLVDDNGVREVHALVRRATTLCPSPTGVAGLAGLMALRARGRVDADARVVVLVTGTGS
jgi:threonine synthase